MSSDDGDYGARYMGICDACRQILVFPTEEARTYWENNHPHEGDQ